MYIFRGQWSIVFCRLKTIQCKIKVKDDGLCSDYG